ncbi:ATP-binding protein [Actinomycetospora sp. TBRC 11914]|uniref:ATP-binding protein n=1 Tax=Actinomycetospora sp. TBRC 11914 TaxID=2729387 RepID=UPI00145E3436|nr:ATP-binding protein [Actinomycetospora sp. TBRC 11914]NMO90361.1 PAS domain-containing protein [Actinomycetospora sp. TBRC 11914]
MSTPDRASSRCRALALEETAEDLYEHAPCGYLSTLPDGEIVRINTTLLGWLGLDHDDVVGRRRFEDLLSVGGRIYHETHFWPLLRMQGEVRSVALDLVSASGTRLPVLVNAVLKTGADGEPLLVRMAVVDAHDRRAYERELLRARRAADEQTRLRQRWVEASGEITTALLAGAGPGEALALVAQRAAELIGASGALITTPVTVVAAGEAPPARVMVAVGLEDRYPAGTQLPVGGTVLGALARTGAPQAVADLVLAPGHPGEGPGFAVPMGSGEEASGVLVVSGVDDGVDSLPDGLSIIASFADQAALVLRYAESQRALRELDVVADRERIAADLHDHVLQRLFALGLGLQAAHTRLPATDAARRVDEAVDQIDGIIRDIRTAIFDLHTVRGGGELAARVRAAATGMAADTDVEPVVRVSGEVEAVPEELVVAAEAVVREGVSNALRHATPSQITVTVSTDGALTVEIVDDGIGIPETVARSGLSNLAARARAAGGDLRVGRRPVGAGTRLTWWVPLDLCGHGEEPDGARAPS